jgi:hypothetical protein
MPEPVYLTEEIFSAHAQFPDESACAIQDTEYAVELSDSTE